MTDDWFDEHQYEMLRQIEQRAAEGDPEAIDAVKFIEYQIDQIRRKIAWAEGKIPFTPDGDPID